MVTSLIVIAIEMLHIAAPWVKDKLTSGSIKRIIDNSETRPTAPRIGKFQLANHHRLVLDIHTHRHRINQSAHATREAVTFARAVEAESREIERELTRQRKQITRERSDLEARKKKGTAYVVSKIDATRDYTTGSLTSQRNKLRAQISRIKNEISLKIDECEGLKQSIEMNKSLADGYLKQTVELERLIKVKSAQQVKEKTAMNNEQKVLTAHINRLEKQTTMTSYRLDALKLELLNTGKETADLKRAADKIKRSGVPRRQLIAARWRYYGTLSAVFVLAAVMLVFNIFLINAAVKMDSMGQHEANII